MPLNDAARAAVAELASQGVRDLSPDEVMALQDCGARLIAAGRSGAVSPPEPPPVEVGGIVIHPMTLAAADFIASATRGEIGARHLWLVVVALVHARDPAALDALDTRFLRWTEARRIMRRCGATRAEIERAVEMVVGGDRVDAYAEAAAAARDLADYIEPDDKALAVFIRERTALHFTRHSPEVELKHRAEGAETRPAADVAYWHGIAAEMAALTGTDAGYWLKTTTILFTRVWRDAAERESRRQNAVSWAFGGAPRERVPRAVVEAIRAMQDEKKRILARRSPDTASPPAEMGKEPSDG